MRTKNVLYYGKDETLPERIKLQAGPLQMVYENGDLRSIQWEDNEILRRIYVAVRDRNWGTVINVFSDVEIDVHEDSFRILYQAVNQAGDINFHWRGLITGEADGTITFSMDGVAQSTFLRNRIGFCVLHPAACAGSPCVVEHVDGTQSNSFLPLYIEPDQPVQPFAEMRAVSHQVEPGLWAEIQFSGDIFEMEDQRNWTDASFKTFCTPLRIPYPVEVQEGTHLAQSIQLILKKDPAIISYSDKIQSEQINDLVLTFDPGATPLPLPPIGLGTASHGQQLNAKETERLRALHLDHLRVDVDLSTPDLRKILALAMNDANALGIKLDVGLHISGQAEREMSDFAGLIKELRPPVRCWLVYIADKKSSEVMATAEAVGLARQYFDKLIPGAKFVAGTNADLIFLQRSVLPLQQIDLATFAIVPQVHAFDNTSIVETLEAQSQAVETARYRTGGLPVMISPITLKKRFNPYATGKVTTLNPGELPPQVDARQMSLFGAGWTLGSISALAQCGTASLTYYETTGWRGVMETSSGSPLSKEFQSHPGELFPMYHVFAAVGVFAGGDVVPSQSSDPITFNGLVLRKADRTRVLLANHTPDTQTISIPALKPNAVFNHLDETNVEEAMTKPEEFCQNNRAEITTARDAYQIDLLPYAIAWIDFRILLDDQ